MGECVKELGGSGHALAFPTAKSIMITCQHEWVKQCLIKYRFESLPEGEHWEAAHYPIPECRNGTETVKLWSRDHAVHGFLQSEDLDQVCFHGFRRKTDRALIEQHHPDYLELCDRWFSEAQRRALQKAIEKDPEHQSKAGKTTGRRNVESGHLDRIRAMRDPVGVVERARKQGYVNVENGHLRRVASNGGKAGSKVVNSQKWADPDHPELGEHSAPTLSQMQRRRGYPHGKENRVRKG